MKKLILLLVLVGVVFVGAAGYFTSRLQWVLYCDSDFPSISIYNPSFNRLRYEAACLESKYLGFDVLKISYHCADEVAPATADACKLGEVVIFVTFLPNVVSSDEDQRNAILSSVALMHEVSRPDDKLLLLVGLDQVTIIENGVPVTQETYYPSVTLLCPNLPNDELLRIQPCEIKTISGVEPVEPNDFWVGRYQ